jgi:hypothetical protein
MVLGRVFFVGHRQDTLHSQEVSDDALGAPDIGAVVLAVFVNFSHGTIERRARLYACWFTAACLSRGG